MRKRYGFTLVELLVVIGIIAVLISILLPSLNRARESAKRVSCAAQLRMIGIATHAYAANNKDALPPMNMDDGQPAYNIGVTVSEARSLSFALWGNAPSASEAASPAIGSNIGRLVLTKFLQGDFQRMVSCPSSTPDPNLAYANDPAHYGFNPHWAARTVNGTVCIQPWWRKLSKYGRVPKLALSGFRNGSPTAYPYSANGRDLALASDPTQVPNLGNGNHGINPHFMKDSRAYNLLYADGSVKTAIVSNKLSRNNSGSYSAMIDQLGWAESAASGTQIMGANANSIGSYVSMPIDPP